MKNSPNLLEEVASVIDAAMASGGSSAVTYGTKVIDGAFVLISRHHLPKVTFGSLDDAFGGNDYARTTYLTEKTHNGDFKKMRDIGLQYLVMADYVESKVVKAQIDSAKVRRYKVFRELFPENIATFEEFDWSSLHEFEQMVIDKMVLLKMEVDKNF